MYDHEEKRKGGFTMSGKKERNDSTIGPGPGGYDNSQSPQRNNGQSIRIGTSQRSGIVNERES